MQNQSVNEEISSIDKQICGLLNKRLNLLSQLPKTDLSKENTNKSNSNFIDNINSEDKAFFDDILSSIQCYENILRDNIVDTSTMTCKSNRLILLSFEYTGALTQLYSTLKAMKFLGFELNKLKVKEDFIQRLNGKKDNYKIFAEFMGQNVSVENIKRLERIKKSTGGFKIISL